MSPIRRTAPNAQREHAAPFRFLVPVKLGLKNVKAITRITCTAERGYSLRPPIANLLKAFCSLFVAWQEPDDFPALI